MGPGRRDCVQFRGHRAIRLKRGEISAARRPSPGVVYDHLAAYVGTAPHCTASAPCSSACHALPVLQQSPRLCASQGNHLRHVRCHARRQPQRLLVDLPAAHVERIRAPTPEPLHASEAPLVLDAQRRPILLGSPPKAMARSCR